VWHLQPPARRASVPARRAPISWARPFRRGEPDPLHLAAGQPADGPSGHVAYAGDIHGPADGVAVRGGFPGEPAPVRMAAERDDLADPPPPGHTPRSLPRSVRPRSRASGPHARCCGTPAVAAGPLSSARPLLPHVLHAVVRAPLLLHGRPLRVPLRPATVPSHAPRRPPHARITARGAHLASLRFRTARAAFWASVSGSPVTSTEVVYDPDFPGRKRRPPQILRIV
jgi:hypothetical protein